MRPVSDARRLRSSWHRGHGGLKVAAKRHPTSRLPILLVFTLALAALLSGRVAAQPTLAAADAQAEIARGLEAQFQVSLIRERKLADDRETDELQAAEMEGFLAGLEKSGDLSPQLKTWLAEARSHLAGPAAAGSPQP